ncbi:MAG: adenylate/guanylate cyclase domain-containing protein [Pseudomonadota bacterium]
MSRETVSVAILFADIAKSTHIYETLGDRLAQNLIGTCIALMDKITRHFDGTVIKTIGDEIMCTFPTAQAAVDAAKEMHQSIEQINFHEKPDITPPNIYVGIQFGQVIREEGDVFGDAVNVAARMVAQANQRQIITTSETVALLPDEYREKCHCIDKTTIKGKSGEMEIFEVVWEEHDVTVMLDEGLDNATLKYSLELTFGGTVTIVDESRPTATLGRQLHNDVVVNDSRVSRSHARVEYRRGKFVLIDQSSNGTFLLVQGKKNIHLKRDESPLLGSGLISLGREVNPGGSSAISYIIKM